MFLEFQEYIHDRLEESQDIFNSNISIQQWVAKFNNAYRELETEISDENILKKLNHIQEIFKTIHEVEKELCYSIGFTDGVQLKNMVTNKNGEEKLRAYEQS